MTTNKAANLGPPPSRAQTRNLGEPPKPNETKNNTLKAQTVQLNVRIGKDKHREIRIAAMYEDMDMPDYMVMCHDFFQQHNKGQKRA